VADYVDPTLIAPNPYTVKSLGLDPSPSESAFGVCVTELVDGQCNLLFADEYPKPDYDKMLNVALDMIRKYNITFESQSRIFVDGANLSYIRSLKAELGEDVDYLTAIERLKRNCPGQKEGALVTNNMFVVPIYFNNESRNMLAHTKRLMEIDGGLVSIHPRFNKLLVALRTATENGEGKLDKDATSHDDLFDAFRLSLMFWH
jgi:hypothetical protein